MLSQSTSIIQHNDTTPIHAATALSPTPRGHWDGRLVATAWGQYANLFCFFQDLRTGLVHRCCALRATDEEGRHIYSSFDGKVDFAKDEVLNRLYRLHTDIDSNRLRVWHSATELTS